MKTIDAVLHECKFPRADLYLEHLVCECCPHDFGYYADYYFGGTCDGHGEDITECIECWNLDVVDGEAWKKSLQEEKR